MSVCVKLYTFVSVCVRACASAVAFLYLIGGIVQTDELAVHVQLVEADVAGGRGRVGDADRAAGLRLLHVHALPLAPCGAHAA